MQKGHAMAMIFSFALCRSCLSLITLNAVLNTGAWENRKGPSAIVMIQLQKHITTRI
ncbi:hypothetical protein KC19_7G121900 [Ceratodon purpureus]|uniref:Secreted protein n=1 Tax=Ceratodon purpureus TaxID=3225 RepID=A0A8T0HA73_CERPU|nr:hypothetical protein KC19_7G121900 [Ceratodon purpureus]